MLKLIGSVMVFGSCAALGLSARQNLRRRVAAADAMLLALGLIRSEISGRRTPMPEIVGLLAENEQPIVRKVFRTLQRRLREQNGLSLGYLWRSTLRDCRAQVGLGTQECDCRRWSGGWRPRGRRRRRIWQIGEICTGPAALRSVCW